MASFKRFRNGAQLGAQFGAWIGLTPRQRSSGGKRSPGGITRQGDPYLRTLLIQGARTLWAAMSRGDVFDPNHLSVKHGSG